MQSIIGMDANIIMDTIDDRIDFYKGFVEYQRDRDKSTDYAQGMLDAATDLKKRITEKSNAFVIVNIFNDKPDEETDEEADE